MASAWKRRIARKPPVSLEAPDGSHYCLTGGDTAGEGSTIGNDVSPGRAVLPLFAATLSLSALLMFSLQPMFAKLVLPLYGGSAAVWNTALVCHGEAVKRRPVTHHLTEFQLWLADGGIAMFHISNRYLNLAPVLANLVADAGLAGRRQHHGARNTTLYVLDSDWIAVARTPGDLAVLSDAGVWEPLVPDPREALWNDDYSNVFKALKW